MQDIKTHCDDGSLNYSIDIMDECDNPKKKSPTKIRYRSFEDCKRNEHGGRRIFDGTDGERDRFDGNIFVPLFVLFKVCVSWFISYNQFSCIFDSFIFQILCSIGTCINEI